MKVTILVTFLAGASLAQAVRQEKVSPTLQPKEDSKFFGPPFPADYPEDGRPRLPISKHFDHPYPIVQDTAAFDRDYVQDENNDNGEWAAQFNYDKLRGSIRGKKKLVESARKRKEQEEKELRKASASAQGAEGKYKKSEEETAAASKKFVDSEFEKEEAEGKAKKAAADADAKEKEYEEASKVADAVANGDTTSANVPLADRVAAAKAKVAEKSTQLEGCKEQLEKAKVALNEVFARQKEEMKKAKEAEEKAVQDKKAKAAEGKEAAAKDKEKATAALKEADSATAAAEGTLAEQQKKADSEKQTLDKAQHAAKNEERQKARADQYYEEEVSELKATEAELKAAEMKEIGRASCRERV